MKKVIVYLLSILFFLCGIAVADVIDLNQNEVINTPQSSKMEWEITRINASKQILQIKYRWLDSNGTPIRDASGNVWKIWTCRNIADSNPVSNSECTDVNTPDECCTGAGTGNCDVVDTCFSDVFGFNIRSQDVGTSIGVGLRTLIWNKMKDDVLSGGNDGSFE